MLISNSTDAFYIKFAKIPTKFGEIWSSSRRIAKVFEVQIGGCHLWIWVNVHFWHDSCVLYWICEIPIKFVGDLSNCEEMATVFWNSRWRQPPYEFWLVYVSWQYSAFYIRFATFPQNVVRIRLLVKKWQQFFGIQDGDSRHLEFCWMSIHTWRWRSIQNL